MSRILRLWAVALCAAALLTSAFLPGMKERQPRELRVGIYQNEPKIFINEAGEPAGIFVELLNEIAAPQGATPQIRMST